VREDQIKSGMLTFLDFSHQLHGIPTREIRDAGMSKLRPDRWQNFFRRKRVFVKTTYKYI
jgi:hypothetical protein